MRAGRLALTAMLLATACGPAAVEPSTTTAPPTTTPPTTIPATTTTTQPPPVLSDRAAAYLDEALGAMRQYSINRNDVDWEAVEDKIYRAADGAKTTADTYFAVSAALHELGDRHSFFLTPEEASHFSTGADFEEPTVEVRDGVGQVTIGSFRGDIGPGADAYASELAARITAERACGWIVDLRGNGGGNMWPMLAGLAPLLAGPTVGSFVYPDGVVEPWEVVPGEVRWRGETMVRNGLTAGDAGTPPIAVLIGGWTASSGEAVAVAFHGSPGVRFFGYPTAGLTTANEPVPLSDGSMLALTMSAFADRAGLTFGQGVSVEPDETGGEFRTALGDDLVADAETWLLTQPGCVDR